MLASAGRLARTLGRTKRPPFSSAMLPLLVLLKFVAYFAVFRAAPRLLAVSPADPGSFAAKWAVIRMALGLLVGLPLFVIVGYFEEAGLSFMVSYFLVMLPARGLLWALVCASVLLRNPPDESTRRTPWVACGVLASFAVDGLAMLLGIENVRLFC